MKSSECGAKILPNCNIFLNNLPRWVDDDWLLQEFRSFGPVISSKVMKKGKQNPSFGFVQFASYHVAIAAIAEWNGRMFDGIEVSARLADNNKTSNKSPYVSARLLIENHPFTASEAQLRVLFQCFGPLAAVHPSPGDGDDRATVEFVHAQAAEAAKLTLHGLCIGHSKPMRVRYADEAKSLKPRKRCAPQGTGQTPPTSAQLPPPSYTVPYGLQYEAPQLNKSADHVLPGASLVQLLLPLRSYRARLMPQLERNVTDVVSPRPADHSVGSPTSSMGDGSAEEAGSQTSGSEIREYQLFEGFSHARNPHSYPMSLSF